MDLTRDEKADARRRARKAQEAKQKAEAAKWRAAQRARDRWTPDQFDEEDERLAAEVTAFIAAGSVTTFPAMWAHGSTGRSMFGD